jgi:hypothetical protein
MKKKKYNFNNIKIMKDKKIVDPQDLKIKIEKANWRRKNSDHV